MALPRVFSGHAMKPLAFEITGFKELSLQK